MAKTIQLCKVDLFSTSPNSRQRTTMWNTHASKIVTFHSDYLYPTAHFCIINSAEGATWFINFVLLNILKWKHQITKKLTMSFKHV